MSLSDNVIAAFRSVAMINGGRITLGARDEVPCILPEGISRQTETDNGVHRSEVFVSVTAAKSDIGSPPRAGERATLSYAGENYKLAVAEDENAELGGALYTFTCAG